MIELPTLYPHQESHRDKARRALLASEKRGVIICAPPGCGKTRLSKWIIGSSVNRPRSQYQSGKALFAVHRRGLVDNASDSFNEIPSVKHGTIMNKHERLLGRDVQVASIDSFLSWYVDGLDYSCDITFDLIVFDEAHSHLDKLKKLLEAHNAKRLELELFMPYVIALTATPEAKGLADLFTDIVEGESVEWLIANKYLSPYRYVRATTGDLTKLVKTSTGEFSDDSDEAAMTGIMNGDLVRDWKQFGMGRATIGFFPSRNLAKQAAVRLEAAGLRTGYLDCETPDTERKRMFADMAAGRLDYICNVAVVERGTDIPIVACIQMCTAVGSLVRWRQMIGRGSRMHSAKRDCLVIDHGGNIKRHGYFEDAIPWTLDRSHRATKAHVARVSSECPRCHESYRGGKCPHCNYEPTKREMKAQGLEFDGQELVEIQRKPRTHDKTEESSDQQLLVSGLYMAGKKNKTFRQALAICYGRAEKLGRKFKVPSHFEVASKRFKTIPYGHSDQTLRVCDTYPFTVGNWTQEANRYMVIAGPNLGP